MNPFDRIMKYVILGGTVTMFAIAILVGLALRAEAVPRNIPDNQKVQITVQYCETDRSQMQWVVSTSPEISVAFIRLVFGYIAPAEFKQIVLAVRWDDIESARGFVDGIIAQCFAPPGRPL